MDSIFYQGGQARAIYQMKLLIRDDDILQCLSVSQLMIYTVEYNHLDNTNICQCCFDDEISQTNLTRSEYISSFDEQTIVNFVTTQYMSEASWQK